MKKSTINKDQTELIDSIHSLFDGIECERREIDWLDFSIPENRIKWYPFGSVLRERIIDPLVGRNTMLALLRVYGILDKRNKPIKEWILNFCFKITLVKNPVPMKLYSEHTYISVQGIYVIRGIIKELRRKGAGI